MNTKKRNFEKSTGLICVNQQVTGLKTLVGGKQSWNHIMTAF